MGDCNGYTGFGINNAGYPLDDGSWPPVENSPSYGNWNDRAVTDASNHHVSSLPTSSDFQNAFIGLVGSVIGGSSSTNYAVTQQDLAAFEDMGRTQEVASDLPTQENIESSVIDVDPVVFKNPKQLGEEFYAGLLRTEQPYAFGGFLRSSYLRPLFNDPDYMKNCLDVCKSNPDEVTRVVNDLFGRVTDLTKKDPTKKALCFNALMDALSNALFKDNDSKSFERAVEFYSQVRQVLPIKEFIVRFFAQQIADASWLERKYIEEIRPYYTADRVALWMKGSDYQNEDNKRDFADELCQASVTKLEMPNNLFLKLFASSDFDQSFARYYWNVFKGRSNGSE